MNERQEKLLNIIISHYTKTALPVGSKLIVESGNFDLSSATIRNEMAELEEFGYIEQPYTSAGRIPTEKGYQFYISKFLEDKEATKRQQEYLIKIIKPFKQHQSELMKELAKGIAELSSEAVFVGFSSSNFYYTGLSNLFSQPEFIQPNLVYNLSKIIDHLDQIIGEIFFEVEDDIKIFIGSQNPFGRQCGSIIARYSGRGEKWLVGILGPLRMDYQNNYSLIRYTKDLINNLK